jgi:hypothetical protein
MFELCAALILFSINISERSIGFEFLNDQGNACRLLTR